MDGQGTDAVRILAGAHTAAEMSERGHLAPAAGTVLPHDGLSVPLQERKHEGPAAVLQEGRNLRDNHPEGEEISTTGASRENREARLLSPQEHKAGGPSGSGQAWWSVATPW